MKCHVASNVGRVATVVGHVATVVGRVATVVGRQCCRGLRDSRSKGLEFNIAYNSFGGTVFVVDKTIAAICFIVAVYS